MLLLVALLQEPHNVAGFGDFGEVDLGLDLGLACFFLLRRSRLGGKMLPDSFRFIGFH
jgi:hypothetical protein